MNVHRYIQVQLHKFPSQDRVTAPRDPGAFPSLDTFLEQYGDMESAAQVEASARGCAPENGPEDGPEDGPHPPTVLLTRQWRPSF